MYTIYVNTCVHIYTLYVYTYKHLNLARPHFKGLIAQYQIAEL